MFHVYRASPAMEPSRVWKNLLSGKQAVPTVACPSCGAQVPEFRIHSHLDTCLATLPIPEEEPAPHVGEAVHEVSDGGEQTHHRGRGVGARGQGRGRGRGRKRREAVEKKGRDGEAGRKRNRSDVGSGENVEGDKVLDAPAVEDDDDDYARFYQRWEYSVAGLEELGKKRKEGCLSDLQKQELSSFGVLTIERHEVSAMVLQLDRLLADFQTSGGTAGISSMSFREKTRVQNGIGLPRAALNQVGMPEQVRGSSASLNAAAANGHDGTQSDQGKALEAWWDRWARVEWPDGPLPAQFHAGLPPRSESGSCAAAEEVGTRSSAAQETAAALGHRAAALDPVVELGDGGGIIGGRSAVLPRSSEVSDQPGRRGPLRSACSPGRSAAEENGLAQVKERSWVLTQKRAWSTGPLQNLGVGGQSRPHRPRLRGETLLEQAELVQDCEPARSALARSREKPTTGRSTST